MSSINAFHEIRFPTDLALGATGGPQRRTEVVTLASGSEKRNSRWYNSRRRFNAGYGIKTLAHLQEVIAFFEARRGRLFGFRFRDPLDWKSAFGSGQVRPGDQVIGVGDGILDEFQLKKTYGFGEDAYVRVITKPVSASLQVSVDGLLQDTNSYELDDTTGMITFEPGSIPQSGASVLAGFEFDIPVRFDTDEISVNLSHFEAGDIPSIPLVELLT